MGTDGWDCSLLHAEKQWPFLMSMFRWPRLGRGSLFAGVVALGECRPTAYANLKLHVP